MFMLLVCFQGVWLLEIGLCSGKEIDGLGIWNKNGRGGKDLKPTYGGGGQKVEAILVLWALTWKCYYYFICLLLVLIDGKRARVFIIGVKNQVGIVGFSLMVGFAGNYREKWWNHSQQENFWTLPLDFLNCTYDFLGITFCRRIASHKSQRNLCHSKI